MLGLCTCLFSRHISRNAVVSGKSPFYFSGSHSSEAMVSLIDHLVACSTRISVDRQTDKPSTETLAAHAHAGVVGLVFVTPHVALSHVFLQENYCAVFFSE